MNQTMCVIHIGNKNEVGTVKHVKPSSSFLTGFSKAVLLLLIFFCYLCFVFVFVSSVPCSLVIACWEMVCLFVLLFVVYSFFSLPHMVSRVRCGT